MIPLSPQADSGYRSHARWFAGRPAPPPRLHVRCGIPESARQEG